MCVCMCVCVCLSLACKRECVDVAVVIYKMKNNYVDHVLKWMVWARVCVCVCVRACILASQMALYWKYMQYAVKGAAVFQDK